MKDKVAPLSAVAVHPLVIRLAGLRKSLPYAGKVGVRWSELLCQN